MRIGVLTTIATAIAISAVVVSGGGGSTANVFVSTTGNDATCVRGNASLPCLSFQKACSIAQGGDTVEIAAGTYPGTQHVTCTPSSTVTFQPASGATVWIDWDTVGNNGCSYDAADNYDVNYSGHGGACGLNIDGATNVTFKDIHLRDQWVASGGSTGITMQNIDAERLYIGHAAVNVVGGDYGPYVMSPAPHDGGGSRTWSDPTGNSGEMGVTISGATFHDYSCDATCQATGAHPPDCLTIGGQGAGATQPAGAVVLKQSTFYGCGGFDAWIKNTYDTAQKWFTSVSFHDNFFGKNYQDVCGCAVGDTFEVGIYSDQTGQVISNVHIDYNTFDPPTDNSGIGWCSSGCTFSSDTVIGNIDDTLFPGTGCGVTGITMQYNVARVKNSGCDATNTVSSTAISELTNTTAGSENLHLSSISAIAVGAGGTACAGNLDIDGTTRPINTTCDAGADEKN